MRALTILSTDILSNEQLPIHSGQTRLHIPAATLRIVDIEHVAMAATDVPARIRRLAQ